MKYRKKPVVIEAIQWDGLNETKTDIIALGDRDIIKTDDNNLSIKTLEGSMIANIGDWVIKGIQGEIYPCKSDIFNETYEAV